jgi:ankyrin repeat protein
MGKKRLVIFSLILIALIGGIFIASRQKEIKNVSQNNLLKADKKISIDKFTDAILQNDVSTVNQVIKNNAVNINNKDSNGKYPIEMILTFENCEMAEKLLEAGADPYVTTSDGTTVYDKVMKSDNKFMKTIFEKYKK